MNTKKEIKTDYKIIELNDNYDVEKRMYYVEDDVMVNKNRCPCCGMKLKKTGLKGGNKK